MDTPEQRPLRIAIDYDDTYTDPRAQALWDLFIGSCKYHGIDIRIVTARHGRITDAVHKELFADFQRLEIPVIMTQYRAKKPFCRDNHQWEPDIWIEDNPEFIIHDQADYSQGTHVILCPTDLGHKLSTKDWTGPPSAALHGPIVDDG